MVICVRSPYRNTIPPSMCDDPNLENVLRIFHNNQNVEHFLIFRPFPQPSNDGASKPPEKPPADERKPDNQDKTDQPIGMAGQKFAELKTKIEESQRKAEHVGENLRGYALDRFISYIKNYDKVLEKKFPGAMKVYRVFMDGVKFFGRDMIHFVKIRSQMVIKGRCMTSMSRRELEIYYQMPIDMRKVGPIILISAIPFAHYLTMPIA